MKFIVCEDMNQRLLTDFELMLLLATLRVGEDAYGVQIAREVEMTGGRRVLLGAVYAALDRLERNGLVARALAARRLSEAGARSGSFG